LGGKKSKRRGGNPSYSKKVGLFIWAFWPWGKKKSWGWENIVCGLLPIRGKGYHQLKGRLERGRTQLMGGNFLWKNVVRKRGGGGEIDRSKSYRPRGVGRRKMLGDGGLCKAGNRPTFLERSVVTKRKKLAFGPLFHAKRMKNRGRILLFWSWFPSDSKGAVSVKRKSPAGKEHRWGGIFHGRGASAEQLLRKKNMPLPKEAGGEKGQGKS